GRPDPAGTTRENPCRTARRDHPMPGRARLRGHDHATDPRGSRRFARRTPASFRVEIGVAGRRDPPYRRPAPGRFRRTRGRSGRRAREPPADGARGPVGDDRTAVSGGNGTLGRVPHRPPVTRSTAACRETPGIRPPQPFRAACRYRRSRSGPDSVRIADGPRARARTHPAPARRFGTGRPGRRRLAEPCRPAARHLTARPATAAVTAGTRPAAWSTPDGKRLSARSAQRRAPRAGSPADRRATGRWRPARSGRPANWPGTHAAHRRKPDAPGYPRAGSTRSPDRYYRPPC